MINETVTLKWYNINEQLPEQSEINKKESSIVAVSNRLFIAIDDLLYLGTYITERLVNCKGEEYTIDYLEAEPYNFMRNSHKIIFKESFKDHNILWASTEVVHNPKFLTVRIIRR